VRHNWAGNVRFSTDRVLVPRSVGELCAAVRAGSGQLHGLGTGHSFSDVADTDGTLVSLAQLPSAIDVDPGASTVTVSAGLRWGDLAPELHRAGFALHTLGSLPHISVAGSCATGTHGSGVRATCLAASGLRRAPASLGPRRQVRQRLPRPRPALSPTLRCEPVIRRR
jgi:alditol oxidase